MYGKTKIDEKGLIREAELSGITLLNKKK